jgi:ubiquinone/menaquinone biosynthesis C-methylase UbiE
MAYRIFWRLSFFPVVLVLFLAGVVWAQEQQHGHLHQHDSMSLGQYIARLEDPARDAWQKPDAVIQALKLEEGHIVADIGAGSGYFTLRLTQAVGSEGMVYAVDTASGMLHHLRQRLREEGISNVRTMKVPPHDPLLVDGSIDVAFVCNTYHHIEDREVYLRKIRKALKPDGRIIIIEFNKEGDIPVGPPSQMRLSKDSVRKELQAAGLSVTETPVSLPYQYMLMAQTTG